MIKVLLIVPRKDYINPSWKRFLETYRQNNPGHAAFHLEEMVVPVRDLLLHEYSADVIISRGLLSKVLLERKLTIPVVDIPVQGIDLVRSLFACRKKYGKKKVAVIGASNMIYGAEQLEDIVDLKIEQYYLDELSDIPRRVDTAKKDGCEVVMAGINSCAYAKSIGLQSIIIESSGESFHQALNEALRIAAASRNDQQKLKQFQAILDNAYEGVIAIDTEQKITAFNEAAQRILQTKDVIRHNKQIEEVIQAGEFLQLLTDQSTYKEDILSYRSVLLSIKKVPLYLRDQRFGNMVTFQDVTGIEAMENKIRKKLYLKGHVAKHHFHHIIAESSVVKQTIGMAKRYSEVDSNILIIGETGTGKEMYTQSIHNASQRKHQPFVAINCAALPENLLESELFGYAEGAFTGAVKGGKKGIFELAHRGTLFLDEIGEVSPRLQSRLLRVLQEREVMRIGDDKVIPVDVRIIAATNKNLLTLVKNNEFREDLYYRLSVLHLHLPPLRLCKEDIPVMVSTFIKNYSEKTQHILITERAMNKLTEEKWEGNVRELQNFCERLAVLCKGKQIDIADIDMYLPQEPFLEMEIQADSGQAENDEKKLIIKELKANYYHKEATAKKLGLSRTTLWRKMKEYNINV